MKTYPFVAKKATNITEDYLDIEGKKQIKLFTKEQAEAYWSFVSKSKPSQSIFLPENDTFYFDAEGKLVEKPTTTDTKKSKVTE